jgi:hypothetical protein
MTAALSDTIEKPTASKPKTNRFDTAAGGSAKPKKATRAKPVKAADDEVAPEPVKPKTLTRAKAEELARAAFDLAVAAQNDELFLVIDGTKLVFAEQAAHVVTIGPAAAAALMSRNEGNRRIRPQNLNKIITDLNNGDYSFNGSSVVLSTEGLLLDAQHRLLAVIETGVPIKTVIVTGVLVKAQGDMDSGKVRTLGENLRRAGEVNETQLSSALVGIQAWERGERSIDGGKGLTTNNTSIAFLEQNPHIRDIVRDAFTVASNTPGLTHKQVSQLIWAFDKISVEDRIGFFNDLVTGVGLKAGSPVLALRNFLQKDSTSTAKVSPYYRVALTCKAWNHYREGRSIQSLRFNPGGAKPDEFPEPV